jgi:hypothetical protein
LKFAEPDRGWAALPGPVDQSTVAFFEASSQVVLGDGNRLLFWMDRWLEGCSIAHLAPELVAAVPKRRQKSRTVQSGLASNAWIDDVQGALTLPVLRQYLDIRQCVEQVVLNLDSDDRLIWRWSTSGIYSYLGYLVLKNSGTQGNAASFSGRCCTGAPGP